MSDSDFSPDTKQKNIESRLVEFLLTVGDLEMSIDEVREQLANRDDFVFTQIHWYFRQLDNTEDIKLCHFRWFFE